jgi:hypothetical protein
MSRRKAGGWKPSEGKRAIAENGPPTPEQAFRAGVGAAEDNGKGRKR